MYDSATRIGSALSRRSFLKSAATAGLLAAPLSRIAGAASPNGKIQHASIGIGGMGGSDLNQIGSHPNVEIVAICDVDTRRMANGARKYPNARRYQDWRELLEKEGDSMPEKMLAIPRATLRAPPG